MSIFYWPHLLVLGVSRKKTNISRRIQYKIEVSLRTYWRIISNPSTSLWLSLHPIYRCASTFKPTFPRIKRFSKNQSKAANIEYSNIKQFMTKRMILRSTKYSITLTILRNNILTCTYKIMHHYIQISVCKHVQFHFPSKFKRTFMFQSRHIFICTRFATFFIVFPTKTVTRLRQTQLFCNSIFYYIVSRITFSSEIDGKIFLFCFDTKYNELVSVKVVFWCSLIWT